MQESINEYQFKHKQSKIIYQQQYPKSKTKQINIDNIQYLNYTNNNYDHQNYYLSNTQNIMNKQLQKSKIKCFNNNQASLVCIQSNCQQSAFMCLQSSCKCKAAHQACRNRFINPIFQSIHKHYSNCHINLTLNYKSNSSQNKQKITKQIKQSYEAVYQIINQLMDKLSNLRNKFQLHETYFGLRQEQILFIQHLQQNKVNQITGRIINPIELMMNTYSQFNIWKKQNILEDFSRKRQEFQSLFNYLQKNYSKYDKMLRKDFLKQSKIVLQDNDKNMLFKWLSESFDIFQDKIQTKINAQLIFRASQHKFEASQFHKKCDQISSTLIICKNQYNKIIGGFTPNFWGLSSGKQCYQNVQDRTGKTFLFSLNTKQKYKCLQVSNSICRRKQSGPCFGYSGFDLLISDKCNDNRQSSSLFPYNYDLIVGSGWKYSADDKKIQQANRLFHGNFNPNSCQFKIQQYEVYQIKFL